MFGSISRIRTYSSFIQEIESLSPPCGPRQASVTSLTMREWWKRYCVTFEPSPKSRAVSASLTLQLLWSFCAAETMWR